MQGFGTLDSGKAAKAHSSLRYHSNSSGTKAAGLCLLEQTGLWLDGREGTELNMSLLLAVASVAQGFWELAEHIYLGLSTCQALFYSYTLHLSVLRKPGSRATPVGP